MSKFTSTLGSVSSVADQIGSILGGTSQVELDDVTLTVGTQTIHGWQSLRVSRSVERIPSDFDIELTERFPGELNVVSLSPGLACELKIGADLVVTGYIDRYMPRMEDGVHSIAISGRSKCMDLVDCSAEWDGGQISGTSAVDIAAKLAARYGILVTLLTDASKLPVIPQFNLMYGETPAEIIERVTKFSALLYYDDTDGNLLLSQVGTESMASGFTEGVNVKSMAATFTIDQRFSEYKVSLQSTAMFADQGDTNFLTSIGEDPGVRPVRKKILVSEAGQQGQEITKLRALWEAKRRYGRSFALTVVTDSWRDSDGALWTPNKLVAVNLPSMKMVNLNYIIGEVNYTLDDNGTTATLLLMPPEAYNVEPILIQPQPQVEAGYILNTPGGNQNPATPSLAPRAISPANIPTGTKYLPAEKADAILGLYDSPGASNLPYAEGIRSK